ncbi:hypothetical protein JL475_34745 [Streptomyces sp. M2CJ-2]|uniref:hypothetical protein n=1 Tax=Streptomyces sp. M2CJ-2 TaxID=2803948 RepID=UPI0019285B12|nr:hypothetical protein [Streptomyces sp. M2CJ-2]MBL3671011.1 hypothetical protein [Streptomyces sp. M2CJ-2]
MEEYAKAGLPASAVAQVTASLVEERRQLADLRDEATAWLEETEAAERRAKNLAALAAVARERPADMTPAEQAEVLALLDVRVTITGEIPKPRLGMACSMRDWFTANDRLVPDELTDAATAPGETGVPGPLPPAPPLQHRPMPLPPRTPQPPRLRTNTPNNINYAGRSRMTRVQDQGQAPFGLLNTSVPLCRAWQAVPGEG